MSKSNSFLSLKIIGLLLLLTLHYQVVLSSIIIMGDYKKLSHSKVSIPPAGFLKVDNTTFILDIDDDGRVHVNFDIESKRKWYWLEMGSDTFDLRIKFYMSEAPPKVLAIEDKTIQWGEKKHFHEDFKLYGRQETQKVNGYDVSLHIVRSVEHWTTTHRKKLLGVGVCVALAIIIPSVYYYHSRKNAKRLLLAEHNIEKVVANNAIIVERQKTSAYRSLMSLFFNNKKEIYVCSFWNR